MFNVIYRWKLHPGQEAQFKSAWTEMTRFLREERGALGSRLHYSADEGMWIAYAQWPDRATWEQAFTQPAKPELTRAMQSAALVTAAPILMDLVCDLF